MKAYDCIVCLAEEMHDCTCFIKDVEYVKYLNSRDVAFEVEVVSINQIPASYYTDETLRDVESQLRHDQGLIWAAYEQVNAQDYADNLDIEYDRMVDRKAGGF